VTAQSSSEMRKPVVVWLFGVCARVRFDIRSVLTPLAYQLSG